MMNIGTQSVLAGGFGAFSHGYNPSHPLNPENLANPLRTENLTRQGVVTRVVGEGEDTLSHIDPVTGEALNASRFSDYAQRVGAEAEDSVGAARVPGTEDWTCRAPLKEGGSSLLGRGVMGWTPAGRALGYTSDTARNALVRLMDLGGVYTDTNRFGIRTALSAEDLKRDYFTHASRLELQTERLIRETRQNLGDVDAPRIDAPEFHEATRLILKGLFTEDDRAALVKRFGVEGAKIVEAKAGEAAEAIHRTNAVYEAKLVEHGFLRDERKVAALQARIKELTGARKEAVEPLQTEITQLRQQLAKVERTRSGDPALASEIKTRIAELQDRVKTARGANSVDDLRAELQRQLSLPASMGRDYGHAQLWDRAAIAENPADFERFLREVLVSKPDEGWLMDVHGLTARELEDLKLTDPARYHEVLQAWGGDEFYHRLSVAEAAHEAAQHAAKQTTLDLNETLRALGLARRGEKLATLSEARKFRDKFHAELQLARQKGDQLKTERQTIQTAIGAAMQRQLDEAAAFTVRRPDVGAKELAALDKAEQRALPMISDALRDPASAGRVADAGDVAKAMDSVSAAEKVATADPLTAPKAPKVPVSVELTRLHERLNGLNRQLSREDARVRRLERRADEVNEAYRLSAEKLENLKTARKTLEEARRGVQEASDAAAKGLRKTQRELNAARLRTPLDDTVEEIKRALMDRNELPTAIMDRVVPESGRMKARRLILSKEQERVAADHGYLRTDLPNILHAQYDQLSGHIGIREALEIGDGKRFSSWSDIEAAVSREYDDLVSRAAPHDRARLNAERDKALGDMRLLKGRLLGLENLGIDRDSWLAWGSGKMRQANFIRYGSGFLLTSLTDVASLSLRTKLLPTLIRHSAEALRIMRAMDRADLRVFVNAVEMGSHGVALARRLGSEDMLNQAGIGARGTLKHSVTSHVDVAANKLSDAVSVVSGLPYWNSFLKIASGLAVSHRLRSFVLRYDTLSEFQKADLASLGIGKAEAGRLKGFIERHSVEERGRFDPNLEAWLKEPGGELAAQDFRIAVQREMTRAVNTPGVGDTPAIMDAWFGKLALQFQTFAFTFLNRYVTPTAQRVMDYRDMQAVASLGVLMFSSFLVMLGKDLINGRDPEKRFEQENALKTAYELVDRSGLLGWMSPYTDAALKLTGVTSSERYARNGWMESLGGINLGLLRDVQRFGAAAMEGEDADKLMKKALVLAPFSTHIRLFHELTDGPNY